METWGFAISFATCQTVAAVPSIKAPHIILG